MRIHAQLNMGVHVGICHQTAQLLSTCVISSTLSQEAQSLMAEERRHENDS